MPFSRSTSSRRSNDGVLTCPACLKVALLKSLQVGSVTVWQCEECGHSCARGTSSASSAHDPATDLHEESGSVDFLESLLQTRRRQSRLVTHFFERANRTSSVAEPGVVTAIDFGSGRAELCRNLRELNFYKKVVAVDASDIALAAGQSVGAEPFRAIDAYPETLVKLIASFSGRFDLFAFDIVEHFESADIASDLRRISTLDMGGCDRLRYFVIKVPMRSGILHRMAFQLARLGVSGPLSGLLLTRSSFPHRQIFSKQSLEATIARAGLRVIDVIEDADFEASGFSSRAEVLIQPLPRVLKVVAKSTLDFVGQILSRSPWKDTAIYFLQI